MSARFHLGDVLSVTTGVLLSPDGIGGVYRILQHLAGHPVYTHQIPRVSREAKPVLLAQFPALAGVNVEGVTAENYLARLAELATEYGECFDVQSAPSDAIQDIDPVSELAELVHPSKIIVVNADDGGSR